MITANEWSGSSARSNAWIQSQKFFHMQVLLKIYILYFHLCSLYLVIYVEWFLKKN